MPATRNSKTETQNGGREDRFSEGAYADAYAAWGDFYQKMAEEGLDLFQRSVETAQDMMPGAMNPNIYQYWSEGFRDFMQYTAREGMPTDPQGFRQFYDMWLESWSKGFEAYMRTPEFVSSSGKNLEAMSDIQLKLGEMMEEYWHAIHLPSSRDMREIYHKIYLTERKQDEQDRKLDDINQKLDKLLAMGQNTNKSASTAGPDQKSTPKSTASGKSGKTARSSKGK